MAKTKDKNKIMENQLTFDFFNEAKETKINKPMKIFRKQNVSVKKNHLKKNRKVRKF